MVNPFSQLWSTKLSDWQRGLVVAIMTVPLTIIYDSISNGTFSFDWKKILSAAIIGGVAYILKNFGTGINGNILTNSPKSLVTGGVDPVKPDSPK